MKVNERQGRRGQTPPQAISLHAAETSGNQFTEVTWRQGIKGSMTSRFTVLTLRPAGKQSLAAAGRVAGGRCAPIAVCEASGW